MSLALEQLRIADPCPADLAAMPGDDRSRFCSACNRNVHLISGLTRAEATDLLCQAASARGHLPCIQLQRNTLTGEVVTLDYAKPRRRRWPMVAVLVVSSTAAGVAAHFVLKKAPVVAPPPRMLITAGALLSLPSPPSPNAQTVNQTKKLAPKSPTRKKTTNPARRPA